MSCAPPIAIHTSCQLSVPPSREAPRACTHPLNFVMAGLLSRPPMKTLLPRTHEFPKPHWRAPVFMGRRDVKLVLRPRFARTGGPGDDESREIEMCACPGRFARRRNLTSPVEKCECLALVGRFKVSSTGALAAMAGMCRY